MDENIIRFKDAQLSTRGIKHWGLILYVSALPRIKSGV
jgi:hypothetical protein